MSEGQRTEAGLGAAMGTWAVGLLLVSAGAGRVVSRGEGLMTVRCLPWSSQEGKMFPHVEYGPAGPTCPMEFSAFASDRSSLVAPFPF